MKTSKRWIALLLALAFVLTMIGCSKDTAGGQPSNGATAGSDTTSSTQTSPTKADKVTLTMATFLYVEAPHRAVIDRLVEAYNKQNKNVEISISGAGYGDFWNNLTSEILANNETDIVQIYPENLASYQSLREGGTFTWLIHKV